MGYIPTDEDISLLFQHHQEIYSKIELVVPTVFTSDGSNTVAFKVVASYEGLSVEASIDIDANSDIRRTYTGQLVVDEFSDIKYLDISDLINKFAKIYTGIRSQITNAIKWYPIGMFAFNRNGLKYDHVSRVLSVSCSDMVSFLDNTLSGQMSGYKTLIEANENNRISDVVRAVLDMSVDTTPLPIGIKIIDYPENRTIPYDMEFSTGATVWDMLKELRDLYYPYEMFFDNEKFVFKEIPNGNGDPLLIDSTVFDKLVISEDTTVDYSTVRNCVDLFGANVSYAVSATSTFSRIDENTYDIVAKIEASGFRERSNCLLLFPNMPTGIYNDNTKFRVQLSYDKINSDGTTELVTIGPFYVFNKSGGADDETYFTMRNFFDYRQESGSDILGLVFNYYHKDDAYKFYCNGLSTIRYMVKMVDREPTEQEKLADYEAEGFKNIKYIVTDDPNDVLGLFKCPFTIDKIGRRNLVCSGGEFDNIYTNKLALERAEYELWKAARLTDTIQVQTLFVPWLDVNKKVSYTPRYMHGDAKIEYIIKKISISLSNGSVGTMDVTMTKFYPYYPYIVDKDA